MLTAANQIILQTTGRRGIKICTALLLQLKKQMLALMPKRTDVDLLSRSNKFDDAKIILLHNVVIYML